MSSSFGYFNKIGYKGHLFPIVIGESGSRYTDVRCCCCSLACFPFGFASAIPHTATCCVNLSSSLACHVLQGHCLLQYNPCMGD